MKNIDLKDALAKCRKTANDEELESRHNLAKLERIFKSVRDAVQKAMDADKRLVSRDRKISNDLSKQLSDTVQRIVSIPAQVKQELDERRETLSDFTIVLFGRTMAGKSTLMEILTNGNGASIGKGAQRTTRDVRKYKWNGLSVVDVPGIGAVDGAYDEKIAFEHARNADLIVSLITNDGAQSIEAEHLAKLRRIGKSIIGVFNVKLKDPSSTADEDVEDFFEDLSDEFSSINVEESVKQFNLALKKFSDGLEENFTPVHLRSRFLAGRREYSAFRDQLCKCSRFGAVEKRIVKEVVSNGCFLRARSFLDAIIKPMTDVKKGLQKDADTAETNMNLISDKKQKLEGWRLSFKEGYKKLIADFVHGQIGELRKRAQSFSEDHYDDQKAGENWKKVCLNESRFTDNCKAFCISCANECEKTVSKFRDELKREIGLSNDLDVDIESDFSMDSVWDTKKIWNWATLIVGGVLGIAAFFVNPLGWAALAVGMVGGLFSSLFSSKEKKIAKARSKLLAELNRSLDKAESATKRKIEEFVNNKLVGEFIDGVLSDMGAMVAVLEELGVHQHKLLVMLDNYLFQLNSRLVKKAFDFSGFSGASDKITTISREPGETIILGLKSGAVLSNTEKCVLEKSICERIIVEGSSMVATKEAGTFGIVLTGDKGSATIRFSQYVGRPILSKIVSDSRIYEREHFRLAREDERWEIIPCIGCQNPTAVNGKEISGRTELFSGDMVCAIACRSGNTSTPIHVQFNDI